MATSTTLKKTAQRSGPVVARDVVLPSDELHSFLEEEEPEPQPVRESSRPAPVGKVAAAHSLVEPVLQRLMAGAHKAQFLLLADWFESAMTSRNADVYVVTEVGDVKFEVIDWIEAPGFLKLVVNIDRMPFEPKAMSKMRIRRRDEVFNTTCVSPLAPMFGQLPFAELLLVVESQGKLTNSTMEKNARITPGVTPSAVSGKPSTDVDNDEPVADGEKAASLKGVLPDRDFDVSRDDEDG